jgi:hypothetical protein
MSPNAGGGGVAGTGFQPEAELFTGAQINFGDLTPYLTYMHGLFQLITLGPPL